MPLSAALAVGAMVLAGPPSATAATLTTPAPAATSATPTAKSALDEVPVAGEVAATVSVSDTEKVTLSRKYRVTVTRKLTSKVKASGTALRSAKGTGKAKATVEVTRYAPTAAQAQAEATTVADQAATTKATAAAKKKAITAAKAKAKKAARKVAVTRADRNVRTKFGSVVLKKAKAQKGKPYRYGAKGPRAFDCSGLVNYVMSKGAGVKHLPRTSQALSKKAHHISKKNAKPGDLIFFSNGGHVYHVGIYAGHGKIWHAPGTGRSVREVKIWTSHYSVGRLPA